MYPLASALSNPLQRSISAAARYRLSGTTLAALIFVTLTSATDLNAQLTQMGATTTIRPRVPLPPTAGLPAETVPLQWSCRETPHQTLRAEMVVTRTATLNGKPVTFQEKLATQPTERVPEEVPDSLRPFQGTLHVDIKNPGRIIVNPELQPDPTGMECDGNPISPEELRGMELFYQLKNRQTLFFDRWSFTWGPIAMPVRIRRGYLADNEERVHGGTTSDAAAGIFIGGSYARVHFNYVQPEPIKVTETRRMTFGTFLTLAKVTVDSSSTVSAEAPVTRGVGAPALSSGLALLLNVRGIDVGVSGGLEYAVGAGRARKWDYNGQPWLGVALSYQLAK